MLEQTLVLLKPDAVARGLSGKILARFERAGLRLVAMRLETATPERIDTHYADDPAWLRSVGEKTLVSFRALGLDSTTEFGSDDPTAIGRLVKSRLSAYMTGGPLVALVLEGPQAIKTVRKLVGNTFPNDAAPGTIRGDFSSDTSELAMREHRSIRNLVHASGAPDEAAREIALWFPA